MLKLIMVCGAVPRTRIAAYTTILLVTNFAFLYSGWLALEESGYVVVMRDDSESAPGGRSVRENKRYLTRPELNSSVLVYSRMNLGKRLNHSTIFSKKHFFHEYKRKTKATLTSNLRENIGTQIILNSFDTKMSLRDNRILKLILKRFVEVMDQNGLIYFMYGGTLLGSFRHHGIIPWDDDVDIMVAMSQRQNMYKLLSDLQPQFFLDVKQKTRWKFYSVLSRPIKDYTWSWPFMDLSFYFENATHIWDADPRYQKDFAYRKEDIFPLRNRPFMDLFLPAPYNTSGTLAQNYKIGICEANQYDHKLEAKVPVAYHKAVPCRLLKDRFPMVRRTWKRNNINETLEVNGRVMGWFVQYSGR